MYYYLMSFSYRIISDHEFIFLSIPTYAAQLTQLSLFFVSARNCTSPQFIVCFILLFAPICAAVADVANYVYAMRRRLQLEYICLTDYSPIVDKLLIDVYKQPSKSTRRQNKS